MSEFVQRIRLLIRDGEVRISEHGYDELANDGVTAREAIAGVAEAKLVEEYPRYPKGHCALLLQQDAQGKALHVLWGIPKTRSTPVVLVTAYRPDSERWDEHFLHRK